MADICRTKPTHGSTEQLLSKARQISPFVLQSAHLRLRESLHLRVDESSVEPHEAHG